VAWPSLLHVCFHQLGSISHIPVCMATVHAYVVVDTALCGPLCHAPAVQCSESQSMGMDARCHSCLNLISAVHSCAGSRLRRRTAVSYQSCRNLSRRPWQAPVRRSCCRGRHLALLRLLYRTTVPLRPHEHTETLFSKLLCHCFDQFETGHQQVV